MNTLTVSPSPHLQSKDSVSKIMRRVNLSLLPALLWSFYAFGLDAAIVTLTAIVSCVAFEYIIQKFILKTEPSIIDGSALLTGILLAFNVPSILPLWIVVIGALVAIGIGKMSFGGLGNNLFNPALVGRVFLLISFPVQMTTWPSHRAVDAVSGATPLALIKEAFNTGHPVNAIEALPSALNMFLGNIGGSMGEISGVLLVIGFIYLLITKCVTWHTPVAILGSMFILSGILNLSNPEKFVQPIYHIVAGGALLGALYMATDMVTSPMTGKGQIIYGVGIGVITICIRTWGAYPEGISFAILIMNAFTPLINKYVKPKRFGEKK